MSSRKPSETNRTRKIAGSFKGKLSSLFNLSRAPSPSSIVMDSSSDNPTRWVTKFFSPTFHWNSFVLLLSISPLNKVPVVHVDHAPAPVFSTEPYSPSPAPTIPLPVSGLIPVPKQLDSASGGGLETRPTVSDRAELTIVVANYWSFSTCIRTPVVHYRPRCPMLSRKYPRNQNKISLWVA